LPEGFLYGSEYKREDINRALASENPYEIVPERDEIGHGTAMAAIAAGNEQESFSGVSPLADIMGGKVPSVSIMNAFLGYEGGAIGEVSALLLLAGFLYLLINKVVTWHIPVTYIATVFVLCFIFPMEGMSAIDFALMEIFSGGLFLGAIFMATDYVTSPITSKGCIIYGIGCGLITVFVRYFSNYPEGTSFAILIMNLLVWYIDRYTKPRRFGGGKRAKQ